MKKKTLKYSIIMIVSVALIMAVIVAYFFFSTMSIEQCKKYCIKNSNRHATEFVRFGDSLYGDDYTYFVAADGDSSSPQEIFVFKPKSFGFIYFFERYSFVTSSIVENNNTVSDNNSFNKVGSIQFFTNKNTGENNGKSTLIFYGAIPDSNVLYIEYTITIPEGSLRHKTTVTKTGDAWFVKFNDIEYREHNSIKKISDVKFYDINGNLIASL